MAGLFKDAFTAWLETQGIVPKIYQPGGLFGPPLGWEISLGRSRIVYRVDPSDTTTLILGMIERDQDRQGLYSPFADLVRFIKTLHQSRAGLTHVNGHINAVSWRPEDSLDTARMKPFYVKHLGGRYFTDEQGVEWVRGSVAGALEALERVL